MTRTLASWFVAAAAVLFACGALAAAPAPLSESDKIDALIRAVEARTDLTFLRNDTAYTPREAARHLRSKLAFAGSRVKTADDFIDRIAAGSSMSGKPYFVRFLDGKLVTSAEFLRQELARIAQAPAVSLK